MLKHKFFDSHQENTTHFLGDNCHQQQKGAIPVWVVTDLQGNILLNNKSNGNNWVVTGGRITINRMFQASTAMLVLSCERLDFDLAYPELPKSVARSDSRLKGLRAQLTKPAPGDILYYPLDKNDEICIWCGYIESIRAVEEKDLGSNLIRRFVGVIDTLTCSGTPTQGVTMIIQCRDRLKYLMDSIGTFNTADFDPLAPANAASWDTKVVEEGADPLKGGEVTISRADVIIEIARRCIGHLDGAPSIKNLAGVCGSVCGTRIHFGYLSQYTQDTSTTADFQNMYDLTNVNNDYIGYRDSPPSAADALSAANGEVGAVTNTKVPFIGGKTTTKQKNLEPDLTFNIVTGRLPYKVKGMNQSVLGAVQGITDRVPAEFIKFLSFQEPWPTEFFCDSRSGEYWYAPRGLDISGLVDPKRFYRTYFFRNAPNDALPHLVESSQNFVANYKTQLAKSEISAAVNNSVGASEELVTIKFESAQFTVSEKRVIDHFTDPGSQFMKLTPWGDDLTSDEKAFIAEMRRLEEVTGGFSFGENKNIRLLKRIRAVFADTSNRVTPASEIPQAPTEPANPAQPANEIITQPNPNVFGSYIHSAQAALLYREESSSINWRSNVVVINQPTNDVNNQSAVHLKLNPPWLAGRNYACSYFQATDTTIGNNQAELVSVAMAYARIFSKELKAATLHITGDPSIIPGEAVQVVGSPMHPEALKPGDERGTWKWDRQAVVDYVAAYRDLYTSRLEAHKRGDVLATGEAAANAAEDVVESAEPPATEGGEPQEGAEEQPTAPATPASAAQEVNGLAATFNRVQTVRDTTTLAQAQLLCPATFGTVKNDTGGADKSFFGFGDGSRSSDRTGEAELNGQKEAKDQAAAVESNNLNTISFPEDPKTIWRVEAVIDKFNEDQSGSGYRTELALLAPF